MQQRAVFLTVNSPVLGSNPTCTVCSKSTGDEISGRSFTAQGGKGEGKEGGKGEEMEKGDTKGEERMK